MLYLSKKTLNLILESFLFALVQFLQINPIKRKQMKNSNLFILAMLTIFFVGCSKDDDAPVDPVVPTPETADLKVTLNGIEPLGNNYIYEGWIIVNGNPVSTGRFNTQSTTTTESFSVLKSDLDLATAFVLSLELVDNDPPTPSDTKILMGEFVAGAAALKIDNVIGNFANTASPFSGSFLNKTPSDNSGGVDNGNDENGIWFIEDLTTPGLINLPTLSPGWKYEGWVVFDGPTPLSTGKFTLASGVDSSSPYSGNEPVPSFPGEDFVQNLPSGITGDTTGRSVVISLEPDFPTDPTEPFFLKPITGMQGPNTLGITTNINVIISGSALK